MNLSQLNWCGWTLGLLYRMKKVRGEKQILYINAYIWDLEKTVLMNLSAGQKQRHSTEQTCGHSLEKGGRVWWTESTENTRYQCRQWTVDTAEEGQGATDTERGTETHTFSSAQSCPTLQPHELKHARPPCVKQITCRKLLKTTNSILCLWQLRGVGWGEEGGWRGRE